MDFDYKEYAEALDEFLLQMEAIHSPTDSKIGDAMSRLCQVLRISRMEVWLYENANQQAKGEGKSFCYYQVGQAEESRKVSHSEIANMGAIATYQAYPFAGEPEWTELELEKIVLISKVLFIYNGRVRAIKLVEKIVYKDPYLDVYNLTYFFKACDERIKSGDISKYGMGYFNLRRFGSINQQLGRDDATKVMLAFVNGLQEHLDAEECVCRMGGDNYVVLFHKDKFELVQEYLKGQGVVYNESTGERVFLNATAGYFLASGEVKASNEIMDNITIAFQQARNVSNEPFVIYSEEMAGSIRERKALEELFPKALEKGEFVAYYQPKVAMKDYTLAGAEALCRWFHNGEMVMPGKFIPVLERSKAINALDFYMLATGERNGSIMLGHVISMAQEMGLECLVEGVETTDQIKFLKQHDCYLAQGFFFDKPLPKDEFEKRLDEIQE